MAKIFHLAIPVEDLDKAIEFYCEILGCTKGRHPIQELKQLDKEKYERLL